MTDEKILLFVGSIVAFFWFVPAIILTSKVRSMEGIEPAFKKQIITPMWTVPLVGNLVCYFIFAKIGKLQGMSPSERRGIWAAAFIK